MLEAATAPEVDGPITPTTDLSATYFCASVWAGAGPCSTGVSPGTSLIFSPSFAGSVATAYFAHVSCSWPRKAATPVSGVTNPILRVLEQLSPAEALAGAAVAGTTVIAAIPASAAAAATAVTRGYDIEIFIDTPWW